MSPEFCAVANRPNSDPVRREFLGERARDRVHAEFSVDRMVAAYERLWTETLAAPRASRLRVRRRWLTSDVSATTAKRE